MGKNRLIYSWLFERKCAVSQMFFENEIIWLRTVHEHLHTSDNNGLSLRLNVEFARVFFISFRPETKLHRQKWSMKRDTKK